MQGATIKKIFILFSVIQCSFYKFVSQMPISEAYKIIVLSAEPMALHLHMVLQVHEKWKIKKTSVVQSKRAKERSGKVHRELHILCLSGTQKLIANYSTQHLKKFYVIPLHVSQNIIALRTVNLKELRKILSEINLWTLKGKSLCMFEKPVVHSNAWSFVYNLT